MIEFSNIQITVIQDWVEKALKRNGFDPTLVSDFFPKGASSEYLDTSINMFLALGVNCTGMSTKMRNAMKYVHTGVDRFFMKLEHRRELYDGVFKADKEFPNAYSGRHNLALDYYVAPAVFDSLEIPPEVISIWNHNMRHIKIRGHHGIKFVRFHEDNKTFDEVKYVWVDRYVK